MIGIFYIIEQEVIMAKLIGFSEYCRSTRPVFKINDLQELRPDATPNNSYTMIHNGPLWGIGYQREVRFFLDDGTHVDFIDDFDGQIRFLKDYIDNNGDTPASQKLEITSEVEFMDI
jgi:hypothetical protein